MSSRRQWGPESAEDILRRRERRAAWRRQQAMAAKRIEADRVEGEQLQMVGLPRKEPKRQHSRLTWWWNLGSK